MDNSKLGKRQRFERSLCGFSSKQELIGASDGSLTVDNFLRAARQVWKSDGIHTKEICYRRRLGGVLASPLLIALASE